MFRKQTLFVMGAGASREAGLPIGAKLAEKLSDLLRFEHNAGHFIGPDPELHKMFPPHLRPAALKISRGVAFANSIDEFIDAHKNDPTVATAGKAAIVYSILQQERLSTLFADREDDYPSIKLASVQNSWFLDFGRMLVRDVDVLSKHALFNNVSIICFNYDRCIEQYLTYTLRDHYSISHGEAAKLVSSLDIIRPYGSIGSLEEVYYGKVPSKVDIFKIAENIKTYTEQVRSDELRGRIGNALERARTIIFLGFGYNVPNMHLLQSDVPLQAHVIGTAKGLSSPDREIVRSEIFHMCRRDQRIEPSSVVLEELECCGLFDKYRRTFTGN